MQSLAIDLCSTEEDTECNLSEDEIFARKLQKEFDAEPGSVEEFECPVCLEEKPIDSKFIYQNCDHVQCRDCASDFFTRQIELNNKINCVLCQQEVATLDLELVLSNDLGSKYLKSHKIEADQSGADGADEGDDDGFGAHLQYVVPKRPVKPKAVKRAPTSKILAPPTKKVTVKKKATPQHRYINNEPSNYHPTFLDQEYVPGNIESGIKKSYKTTHTKYDRTSSDSDSYEVPKKIPKKAEHKVLKRKLT
jgi:hypothetical protein